MRTSFPAAHDFLQSIENHLVLWLSTSVNAHVYGSNCFFAYIKLEAGTLPARLIFSPKYNTFICQGTVDCSGRIFPGPIKEIVERFNGFHDGWARWGANGEIIVYPAVPPAFFLTLLDLLVDHVPDQ